MKTFVFLVFLSMTISLNVYCQKTDTEKWSILMGGKSVGFVKKWKNNDGTLSEWLQFKDNGRGDSTVTVYKYNDRGYITYIDGKGLDYWKKPVFEKYENSNGLASWHNASEKEEKKINYEADYVGLSIQPGTMFNNYFNEPNNTIKLLPTGESKLTVLREMQLSDGNKIRLVSTRGTGFTPSYAWIDNSNELFALAGNSFAIIKEGYEKSNDEFVKLQEEFSNVYFQDIAKRLTDTPQFGIAIKNASVFNSKTGKLEKNTTILIKDGIIQELSHEKITIPKDYKVIDAVGKFIMPGLWDMHVHYQGSLDGLLDIGCGVTNVRDLGNVANFPDKKKEIDEGQVIGPRIQFMCGFIDGVDPNGVQGFGVQITSIEEGKIAIKKYADLGYPQIKLYSSIHPDWVKPLAAEAKRLGLRVSGHIPSHMLASEAVTDGYDEIQHINMLFLNFYGKELVTNTPVRFTEVGKRAAFFNFDQKDFKDFIALLKEHKTVIDPTVTVFEDLFTGKSGQPNPTVANVLDRFPPVIQRYWKTGPSLEVPAGMEDTYNKSFHNILKMVKTLYDNGIVIVPGTDGFAGFTLARELENYVIAGIPNKDVLTIATLTSAKVAGKSENYGSIEKGKAADIIIINGNPLNNIQDLRNVETVIKDKNIYQTKDLLESISIKPFHAQ